MTAPGGAVDLALILRTAAAQRQLVQDMRTAARRAGVDASNTFDGAFRPTNVIQAMLPAAGAAIVVGGFRKIIGAAQATEQALNATGQVYGQMAVEVNEFVQAQSRGLGLAKAQAQDYVNQFGSIFIGLGKGQVEAARFAQELTKAGAALAAFRNTSVEQAINALQAGFRGEYDSLQRFIPQVSDLTLTNKALALGLAETRSQVDQQDKAMALLNIVQNSVARSAGQAELEQGNLQTRLAETKAQALDAAANFGRKLVPALEDTLDVVNKLGPANVALGLGLVALAVATRGVGAASVAALGTTASSYRIVTLASAQAAVQFRAAAIANLQASTSFGAASIAARANAIAYQAAAQAALNAAAAQTGLGASLGRVAVAWTAAGTAAARAGALTTLGLNAIGAAALANPVTAIIAIGAASLYAASAGERLEKSGNAWGTVLKSLTGVSPLILKFISYLGSETEKTAQVTSEAAKLGHDLASVYREEGEAAAYAAAQTKILQDVDLSDRAAQYKALGGSVYDYTKALAGNSAKQREANDLFNTAIAKIEAMSEAERKAMFGSKEAADEHLKSLRSNRDLTNETAAAEQARALVLDELKSDTTALTDEQEQLVSSLRDVGNTALTATERADALRDSFKLLYEASINQTDAGEELIQKQIDLRTELAASGTQFDLTTAKTDEHRQKVLDSRDALQEALEAAREKAAADLEAGQTLEQVNATHRANIQAILDSIPPAQRNTEAVKQLVTQYGSIPTDVNSNFTQNGAGAIRETFRQILSDVQYLLKNGFLPPKPLSQMTPAERARLGVGGVATGGRIRGPGGPVEDKAGVYALSDNEFVLRNYAVRELDRRLGPGGLEYMNETGEIPLDGAFARGGRPRRQSPGKLPFARPRTQTPSLMDSDLRFVFEQSQAQVIKRLVTDAIKAKQAAMGGVIGGPGGGSLGGSAGMMRILRSVFPGLPLWSGYRPGDRTLSGNISYHSSDRAVDVPPRRDVAAWINANYGTGTRELITPFQDLNLHNGRRHTYTGAVWNQHNFAGGNAHNHWAYDRGGMMNPGDVGANTGRHPEAVLDAQETAGFKGLVRGDVAFRLDEYTIMRMVQAMSTRPVQIVIDGKVMAETVFNHADLR